MESTTYNSSDGWTTINLYYARLPEEETREFYQLNDLFLDKLRSKNQEFSAYDDESMDLLKDWLCMDPEMVKMSADLITHRKQYGEKLFYNHPLRKRRRSTERRFRCALP